MVEKPIMEGTLGEILRRVSNIRDPKEGFYSLYVRDDKLPITEDTWCAVILTAEEENLSGLTEEPELLLIATIRDLQSIIKAALEDKPNANTAELVKAFRYYLDHDAFLDLS